ncbi:hypothetical protein FSP39_015657 [Pinctada imbricata]|uniref:THAP-type domain-containing protein n=1 Tax=Pinctada imbricata TaxID=66713 RepID=A0AA88YTV4_PINIB|nr:hypothetical protein FSP39_015657 [Pinctada imbricata]
MPSRYFCAAERCYSDTLKKGKYGYMEDVRFFPFPTKKKNPRARKKWLDLLRRKDYEPSRKHRVCSLHFVDGEPTTENPYPTLFAYNDFKSDKNSRQSTRCQQQRITDPQSTGGAITDSDTITDISSYDTHVAITITQLFLDPQPSDHNYSFCEKGKEKSHIDHDCQTDITMEDMDNLFEAKSKLQNPDSLLRELFVNKVTRDDRTVKQYTGAPSKPLLNGLFDILNSSSPNIKYWSGQGSTSTEEYQRNPDMKKSGPQRKLSRYEEFILTLVRLRLAIFTFFLADIFGVSESRVSQTVITWVNLMYQVFGPMIRYPSAQDVKKFMPKSFKLTFPNTRCIIDCTEFFIHKPRSPTAQSQTFSSYKQHNTFKALIGISPTGAIIFVSKLWGGNTSDRYITKESGFLDLIQPGDEIMADRGFLIRDLLLERHAKLIIPPFTQKCATGKGKRLSANDVIKTRNIARLRIHVERAIERIKNFHILSDTMPLNLKPIANQMLTVCAFLCNLQGPLVKK